MSSRWCSSSPTASRKPVGKALLRRRKYFESRRACDVDVERARHKDAEVFMNLSITSLRGWTDQKPWSVKWRPIATERQEVYCSKPHGKKETQRAETLRSTSHHASLRRISHPNPNRDAFMTFCPWCESQLPCSGTLEDSRTCVGFHCLAINFYSTALY